jgi:hypothetical protein
MNKIRAAVNTPVRPLPCISPHGSPQRRPYSSGKGVIVEHVDFFCQVILKQRISSFLKIVFGFL